MKGENIMNKKLDDEMEIIKEEIDKIVSNYDIENLYKKLNCLFMV